MKKTLNEVCRPIPVYEWKGLGQAVRSIYWSNTFDAVFFAEFASLLWLTQWKLGFFHLENRFCIANSSLEITGTQSKFCEYRESYGDINEDDQSCFSICSHIQSVNFSDLHSKLHSQCHFQICAKNRVLRYLGERFPGRMCCAFRGSPPELCPISLSVHVPGTASECWAWALFIDVRVDMVQRTRTSAVRRRKWRDEKKSSSRILELLPLRDSS